MSSGDEGIASNHEATGIVLQESVPRLINMSRIIRMQVRFTEGEYTHTCKRALPPAMVAEIEKAKDRRCMFKLEIDPTFEDCVYVTLNKYIKSLDGTRKKLEMIFDPDMSTYDNLLCNDTDAPILVNAKGNQWFIVTFEDPPAMSERDEMLLNVERINLVTGCYQKRRMDIDISVTVIPQYQECNVKMLDNTQNEEESYFERNIAYELITQDMAGYMAKYNTVDGKKIKIEHKENEDPPNLTVISEGFDRFVDDILKEKKELSIKIRPEYEVSLFNLRKNMETKNMDFNVKFCAREFGPDMFFGDGKGNMPCIAMITQAIQQSLILGPVPLRDHASARSIATEPPSKQPSHVQEEALPQALPQEASAQYTTEFGNLGMYEGAFTNSAYDPAYAQVYQQESAMYYGEAQAQQLQPIQSSLPTPSPKEQVTNSNTGAEEEETSIRDYVTEASKTYVDSKGNIYRPNQAAAPEPQPESFSSKGPAKKVIRRTQNGYKSDATTYGQTDYNSDESVSTSLSASAAMRPKLVSDSEEETEAEESHTLIKKRPKTHSARHRVAPLKA